MIHQLSVSLSVSGTDCSKLVGIPSWMVITDHKGVTRKQKIHFKTEKERLTVTVTGWTCSVKLSRIMNLMVSLVQFLRRKYSIVKLVVCLKSEVLSVVVVSV